MRRPSQQILHMHGSHRIQIVSIKKLLNCWCYEKTTSCNRLSYQSRLYRCPIYLSYLKEYYEIVDEACPLSGFFPHMLIFLRKCIYDYETKQSSKFQSDPSLNCFTIDVWNINCWRQQVIFLLSYCFFLVSHFTRVM